MLTLQTRRLGYEDGQWVLDVGCGTGRHLHAAMDAAHLTAIGLDANRADVKSALDGAHWVKGMNPQSGDAFGITGDAYRLPFADAQFNRVICSEVLEHLSDPYGALKEIARVLKPGGRLAISVPRYWPEWVCWKLAPAYPKEPGGHVRIFRTRQVRRLVEHAGFSYRSKHGAHALHSPYWWLKCLLWKRRDDHPVIRVYERFLEWDILKRPRLTRALEWLLQPLIAKSVAQYFIRDEASEDAP